MPSLVGLASAHDTDPEVKNEACWVVLNATSCGSDLQIEYLVEQGCIAILGELLGENSMVMMALEGLERMAAALTPAQQRQIAVLMGQVEAAEKTNAKLKQKSICLWQT